MIQETIKPKDAANRLEVCLVTIRKMCAEGKDFDVINISEGKKRPTYRIIKKSFDDYMVRRTGSGA